MRVSSSAVMKYSVLGWSHLLLLAVGFIGSCTTSDIFELKPSPELPGLARPEHLYTANKKTHMYLQITPEGKVGGAQDQNLYSMMEIKAVKPGVIVIRGKTTSRYLCMDEALRLYSSEVYKEEDCNFHEDITYDGYNTYVSEKHEAPVSLKPPKGRRLKLFLPMTSKIPIA